MIGRVLFDQASALTWGAALVGPECANIVVPYRVGVDADKQPSRKPTGTEHAKVSGYFGTDDTASQSARVWDEWARHAYADQWAVAPGRLGVVVVDVDDVDLAGELIDLYGDTPVSVESPSGGTHLYYRATGRVRSTIGVRGDHTYDVKAAGSTIHAPGSMHHRFDKRYIARAPGLGDDGAVVRVERGRWQPVLAARSLWAMLPEFRSDVYAEELETYRRADVQRSDEEHHLADSPSLRAAVIGYLRKRPGAVQGAGGDEHTFETFAALGDRGVPQELALELVWDHWNDKCDPPWTMDGLDEKCRAGYRYRRNTIGCRAREFGLVDAAAAADEPPLDIEETARQVAAAHAELDAAGVGV